VTGYETHPIREYVEAGVAVTVNTDNRLFSHTTVTDELLLVHERCGVGAEALREIVLNGFRHAFLSWDEKRELLAEAEAFFASA
jgi:adenosine deaminase